MFLDKALYFRKNFSCRSDNLCFDCTLLEAKNKDEIEQALDCGLVKGHAYAVTAVRLIALDAKEQTRSPSYLSLPLLLPTQHQKMIRLQNPWGEKEWNGPWSDGSVEWDQVSSFVPNSFLHFRT